MKYQWDLLYWLRQKQINISPTHPPYEVSRNTVVVVIENKCINWNLKIFLLKDMEKLNNLYTEDGSSNSIKILHGRKKKL